MTKDYKKLAEQFVMSKVWSDDPQFQFHLREGIKIFASWLQQQEKQKHNHLPFQFCSDRCKTECENHKNKAERLGCIRCGGIPEPEEESPVELEELSFILWGANTEFEVGVVKVLDMLKHKINSLIRNQNLIIKKLK